MKIDIPCILNKKKNREKISMLTAYDCSFAPLVDEAGIDIVLIGDSLANVVLGMETTKEISMDEMINHSRAVAKSTKNAMVIGDMPYCAYQEHPDEALGHAKRFIDEAGCDAVKLEWFDDALAVTERIVGSGIPVMAHIGLTPQTADLLGGFKVQGKDVDTAKKLIAQTKGFEEAGCFSIVFECVPWQIAKIITESTRMATIGIGAGVHCDGQVLVLNDLLGLFKAFRPKFVKTYANLAETTVSAVKQYIQEVERGAFPTDKESFSMNEEEFEKLQALLGD